MKRRAALLTAAASLTGCTAHHTRSVTITPVTVAAASVDAERFDRAERHHERASRSRPTPPRPDLARPRPVPVTTTTVAGTASGGEPFEATCYSPPQFPAGKRTASGAPVGPGSIAADPRVFPFGTRLAVDGWGTGVVVDTGGAIRGRRLDLWMSSLAACLQFGRRTVQVRRLG